MRTAEKPMSYEMRCPGLHRFGNATKTVMKMARGGELELTAQDGGVDMAGRGPLPARRNRMEGLLFSQPRGGLAKAWYRGVIGNRQ